MKKSIKVLALIFAVLMTVTCFVGCGKKQETIVVGYTLYDPMNYKDANGKLIGYDTELAEKVFSNLGYEVIFKEIQWENKYTDLDSGAIDCIWNGFTCNTADKDGVQRAEKVDFSYKYMRNKQVVVIKNTSNITTAADLNGKIGFAEAGSAGESYAKDFAGITYKGATKQTDCLMEVNSGTADFAVVDEQLAKSYCGSGDYAALTIVDGLSSDIEYYAVGFKKGSKLTAKVNAEFEKLGADGTIDAIAAKYPKVLNSYIKDFADQKK